jgi:hypothetical protein
MTEPAPAWQQLGLPGLVDVHVHVMPQSVERKVWAYFANAEEHYGRPWPLAYAWPLEQRRAELQTLGVRAYPGLVYPHKPGMAEWLNSWAGDYAAATPEVVPSATFFPEPEAVGYVSRALDAGVRVFKAHLQVGGYDPRDPLLAGVWAMIADAGVPVVTHCGDGPVPGSHTGVEPMRDLLDEHTGLRIVVAHMGMPQYADFLLLADEHESVVLDTTMAFTDFAEQGSPFPAEQLPALRELGLAGRVVLGSDFPSIPYRYEHQIDALARLELGDDWMRQVLWHAPAALLGLGD